MRLAVGGFVINDDDGENAITGRYGNNSRVRVRTIKDMTDDELKEIERCHGKPVNRNAKPYEVPPDTFIGFWGRRIKNKRDQGALGVLLGSPSTH